MTLHRVEFRAMGTACEIQVAAADAGAGEAVQRAVDDVHRLEARYSRYRDDNVLSAINRVAAAGGAVEVDHETAALLNYADACHAQSGGLFDISSGILRRAWGRFADGRLPDPHEVRRWLPLVGWQRVRWQAPRLEFPQPGMELDFGGIVKEYAVDRAAVMLLEAGLRHGFVNLGGDIRAIGPQPDGSPWRIGLRHPREPEGLLATVALSQGAMASSGDYERCIVIDGVRYGHILDPRSGWPVRTMAAATVVAPLCVVAGSASTIGMLKDADGPAWLAASGLPHLWVTVDGRCGGTLADTPDAPDGAD
ncbi:FAD:protein FMN transferase [Aquabacterium humicola]|uniref:FAD:protein FMN transferase n=1 Tax=Aquabacterium humicola TaxID=3237377 RepID=UPI002543F03B|nr:FAD:protein FMN transferase [Rubrivivax pictus]